MAKETEHDFLTLALSAPVFYSALKVSLLVGTVLALINHGDKLASMSFSYADLLKIALTYLVPYCVSTWSAVKGIKSCG